MLEEANIPHNTNYCKSVPKVKKKNENEKKNIWNSSKERQDILWHASCNVTSCLPLLLSPNATLSTSFLQLNIIIFFFLSTTFLSSSQLDLVCEYIYTVTRLITQLVYAWNILGVNHINIRFVNISVCLIYLSGSLFIIYSLRTCTRANALTYAHSPTNKWTQIPV